MGVQILRALERLLLGLELEILIPILVFRNSKEAFFRSLRRKQ